MREAARGRVIVLGSVNRDLVFQVASMPRAGETVAALGFAEHPGGKGANQAVAAARAGAPTSLAGAIGDDAFGAAMRAFLAAEGIDLAHLCALPDHSTGIATIQVDEHGENAIIVAAGANAAVTPAMTGAIRFAPGDHVLAQFEIPDAAIREGFAAARAAGATTILNPAPMRDLPADLIDLSDILILNETELSIATGLADLADEAAILAAARRLATPERRVVVTLGARGLIAAADDAAIRMLAPAVVARDTTGAGDCFVGVFAASLAAGAGFEAALARAIRAAAISVTRAGAASSMPHRTEIDD